MLRQVIGAISLCLLLCSCGAKANTKPCRVSDFRLPLSRRMPALARAYWEYLPAHPKVEGKITVAFQVGEDRKPRNLQIEGNDLPDSKRLEDVLLREAAEVEFEDGAMRCGEIHFPIFFSLNHDRIDMAQWKKGLVIAPYVPVEGPKITGASAGDARRSIDAISGRLLLYVPGFRFVYKTLLNQHPRAEGKITFRFTIRADGSIYNVQAVRSDFGKYSEFESHLTHRLEMVTFDPIPGGEVTVEYPFLFTPESPEE